MTVDEIMKLANAYAFEAAYYYGSQQDEDEACGKLRAALEAQSARIAELEDILRNIALAPCSDARSVSLARGVLREPKPEVKP